MHIGKKVLGVCMELTVGTFCEKVPVVLRCINLILVYGVFKSAANSDQRNLVLIENTAGAKQTKMQFVQIK